MNEYLQYLGPNSRFPLAIRLFSSMKRMNRSSKTSFLNDRNNEFIFDEEHLLDLLKRLKQQAEYTSSPMTSDDEANLFNALISKSFPFQRLRETNFNVYPRILPILRGFNPRSIWYDIRIKTFTTERIHSEYRQ